MSRRLIDAEKLKKHYAWWDDDERRTLFDQIVDAQPTIDAEPVRHGKWKQTYLDHEAFGERPSIFYCSACCACSNVKTNYCPQCGCRMDEDE